MYHTASVYNPQAASQSNSGSIAGSDIYIPPHSRSPPKPNTNKKKRSCDQRFSALHSSQSFISKVHATAVGVTTTQPRFCNARSCVSLIDTYGLQNRTFTHRRPTAHPHYSSALILLAGLQCEHIANLPRVRATRLPSFAMANARPRWLNTLLRVAGLLLIRVARLPSYCRLASHLPSSSLIACYSTALLTCVRTSCRTALFAIAGLQHLRVP